jgi:hypothetical protein
MLRLENKKRILVSVILTISIIGILLISGPAIAIQLKIATDKVAYSGSTDNSVAFTVGVDIETGERVPVQNITLTITGPSSYSTTCTFNISGSKLTTCQNLTINALILQGYGQSQMFGYGYGYNTSSPGFQNASFGTGFGYGSDQYVWNDTSHQAELLYNVTWNITAEKRPADGLYNASLQAIAQNGNLYWIFLSTSSETASFRILTPSSGQVIANNETVTVDQNVSQVIVTENSPLQSVDIPASVPSTQEVSLNLSLLLSNGNVTLGSNNFTLTRMGTVNYTAEIPAETIISGGAGWDGLIDLPIVNTSSFSAPSGSVDVVIDVGAGIELNFSKKVKLVIGGKAGKRAAWSRGSSTLTDITTQCNNANNPTNINESTSPRECYIDSGDDLLIWTYHFTEFAAYTPPTTTTPSTGGGGGGSMTEKKSTTTTTTIPGATTTTPPVTTVPKTMTTIPPSVTTRPKTVPLGIELSTMQMFGVIIGIVVILSLVVFIFVRYQAVKMAT